MRASALATRALLISLTLFAALPARAQSRPADWAVPVEKPGLPNLARVSDWLWRGAQPTREGVLELAKLHVRTIVDLRAYHSDAPLLAGTGITLVRIPVHTGSPTLEQVIEFLRVISDENRRPIFVHCQHGADRTGLMVAMYRVAMLGWDKQRAIAEMRDGGFGFHSIWQNLVRFILRMDVDLVRRSAKIARP